MAEILKQLSETPLAIIFILTGILFLFLAMGGQLGARIITDKIRPVFASLAGLFFIIIGIFIHYNSPPSTLQNSTANDIPKPPTVVSTIPENGSVAVSPHLDKLYVTFDRKMKNGSWSWVAESEETFPEITGEPRYNEHLTTCSLPVKLEKNKTYVILINSEGKKNFKDENGTSAQPYKFTFTTDLNGKGQ